jgi:hypothetical protein
LNTARADCHDRTPTVHARVPPPRLRRDARAERERLGGRPERAPQLGILGDAGRFTQLTGQRSSVRHVFASLYQANAFPRILEQLRPVPMLALKPGGTPPLDIAQGRTDSSCSR